MKPIQVTCDAACDLTDALYQKYSITPVPLPCQPASACLGDEASVLSQGMPSAAAAYAQVFSVLLQQGFQIIHISVSGQLSPAYRQACAAAAARKDVSVVDSGSFSAGAGHLAILAVELSHAGLDAAEILRALQEMQPLLTTRVLLGQPVRPAGCRPGTALSLLGCKLTRRLPSLQMCAGRLTPGPSYPGSWPQALDAFLRDQLMQTAHLPHDRLLVTYAGLDPEILRALPERIRALRAFDALWLLPLGADGIRQLGPVSLGLHYLRTA